MMDKSRSRIKILGLILFGIIILFLTFNRHSKSGIYNYHSEIWADKAGYYVYLPACLKYHFETNAFPDSIDVKTGNGFQLDHANNKVITKYTYGVALMQLPFYLLADLLSGPLGYRSDGFSEIYHKCIDIAAVVYLLLGLIILSKVLKNRYKSRLIYLVLASLFLGTNLFYYAIDETGMSHIYSFFLFSLLLYLFHKPGYLLKMRVLDIVLTGLIIGLIILVRPSNIIALSVLLLLDIKNKQDFIHRLGHFLQARFIIPVVIIVCIVFLPQLLYWFYTYDSYFYYSYGNEGFNSTNPKILNTLFSPNNGLILYTPYYLMIIISSVYMLKFHMNNGLYFMGLFAAITYVFSSWYDWSFGCSFGARSYVEYLAIFSLPVTELFIKMQDSRLIKRALFAMIILGFIVFNLKMTYSYDGCFYGSNAWDWPTYTDLVTSPTK